MLNCIGWLVNVCWIIGYPDQSWHQAQHLAELLGQPLPPNAYWTGMHHLLTMRCDFLRDYQGTRAQAEQALDRSIQSDCPEGIALGMLDDSVEHIVEVRSSQAILTLSLR
jgi:hypothetical protein